MQPCLSKNRIKTQTNKVKRIRNYVLKYNLYLYFLIQQKLLISGEKSADDNRTYYIYRIYFSFLGPAKAIQWAENAVKRVIRNIDKRVKHCKNFSKKIYAFLRENCFCICGRFIEIIFRQKVHLGHEKCVHLTTVRFIIIHFIEIFS